MAKNNNLMWIIIIAAVIFIVGPQLGLFSINLTPSYGQSIITSDYIVKAGILAQVTFNPNLPDMGITSFVNNVYGVAILNTPITLDDVTKQQLIDEMNSANSEVLTSTGYTTPIFSQNLINLVNKNSYSTSELSTLKTELDSSVTNICNAIKTPQSASTNTQHLSEYNSLVSWCNSKPSSIFIVSGNTYTLNLKDVTYTTTTSTCNLVADETVCNPTTKTVTIPLSKIKLQLSSNKEGSLIIALGEKGIAEANSLTGKYEFDQYAYSLENNKSLDLSHAENYNTLTYPAYTVISNSQNVVDASTGKIKDSGLMDLWYGITNSKPGVFTDWRLWAIIIGILVVLVVLAKMR